MNRRSRVIAYALIAAFGGFVFGYDTAVISGAVGYITEYFHLSPIGTGWAVASALVGCVFGAAGVGELGSRLGRQKTLMLAAACYFVSGVGTAFAWSFTSFWVFRFLGGLAIGLTATAPLYISEIAPKERRGRLTMLYQVAITFGVLVVFVVFVANWRIAQIGTDTQWGLEHGWRWMLGSVTVPAGLFVALLTFLPESPRWLLLQGRDREAHGVLERIATPAQTDAVLKDYVADRSVPPVPRISLTHPSLLPLLLIACALAILQQVVGINAVIYHGIKMMSELIPGGQTEAALFHQVLIGAALFLATFARAARAVASLGFKAAKLDPFGTAQGFIDEAELQLAYDILAAIREAVGPEFKILIDVHARFTQIEALRAARRLAPLGLYWWEEPTTRDRQEAVHFVAEHSPIPVATGEMYDTVGQFFTLAERGGVNIFQPEPMSLGGISNTLAVANLALAHGSYIAPHQSGGPIATAVCLQLAACVPNFLIQEHFDAFNDLWTRDLVTWHPSIDPRNGHLSLPEAPGLGIDLNVEVIKEHPYDPQAFLNIFESGWEKRVGDGKELS